MYVVLYWTVTSLMHSGGLPGLLGNETSRCDPNTAGCAVTMTTSPQTNKQTPSCFAFREVSLLYTKALQTVWATGSLTHGWIHASCDCFYLHVITHICSQFEFLNTTLRQAEQYSELSACIRHHQQLLR
jgi:hypothetical protein